MLKPLVNKQDNISGAENAKITLVEYGDYQCPHCGRAYPIVKHIQRKLGTNLRFVFRNFPLAEMHPNATHAAIAAEAAAAQGKFWEMHDIIFENQENLDDASLIQYASQVGMDVTAFEKDFEKDIYQQKVEADFGSGMKSGVNGTPSFFINGKKYDGDFETGLLGYMQGLL